MNGRVNQPWVLNVHPTLRAGLRHGCSVLACAFSLSVYCAVPSEPTLIVADLHLGYVPEEVAADFHRFLDSVPGRAERLIINGDLFEFWFEYRSVIPEAAFPTLERLATLARCGVRITITGGNHDRFGGDFWRRRVGAEFHPRGVDLTLSGWNAHVQHGDGIGDVHLSSKLMHFVTRQSATRRLFSLLHPDVGIGLVHRMSPKLAGKRADPEVRERVARAQETFARRFMQECPDVDLLVLAHTHRTALVELGEKRWYVNPGAWSEDRSYVMVTEEGPRVERWNDQ